MLIRFLVPVLSTRWRRMSSTFTKKNICLYIKTKTKGVRFYDSSQNLYKPNWSWSSKGYVGIFCSLYLNSAEKYKDGVFLLLISTENRLEIRPMIYPAVPSDIPLKNLLGIFHFPGSLSTFLFRIPPAIPEGSPPKIFSGIVLAFFFSRIHLEFFP